VVKAIERQMSAALASNVGATTVELGPAAYAALTEDWGESASRVVVSRHDGVVVGIASERWPVASTVPTLELVIVCTGEIDHVRVRA
jgi:hypothetical protein